MRFEIPLLFWILFYPAVTRFCVPSPCTFAASFLPRKIGSEETYPVETTQNQHLSLVTLFGFPNSLFFFLFLPLISRFFSIL